jgi:hypothetical protein
MNQIQRYKRPTTLEFIFSFVMVLKQKFFLFFSKSARSADRVMHLRQKMVLASHNSIDSYSKEELDFRKEYKVPNSIPIENLKAIFEHGFRLNAFYSTQKVKERESGKITSRLNAIFVPNNHNAQHIVDYLVLIKLGQIISTDNKSKMFYFYDHSKQIVSNMKDEIELIIEINKELQKLSKEISKEDPFAALAEFDKFFAKEVPQEESQAQQKELQVISPNRRK